MRSKEYYQNNLNDLNSLSHTTWNCKYHIVFAPKYRRKAFYGKRRAEIGKILRELCKWKGVNLIEGEACPDHIHLLVEIPPKLSISKFMGFLKGKSSIIIFEAILVQRILCGHSWKERKDDCKIYPKPIKNG